MKKDSCAHIDTQFHPGYTGVARTTLGFGSLPLCRTEWHFTFPPPLTYFVKTNTVALFPEIVQKKSIMSNEFHPYTSAIDLPSGIKALLH